MSGDFPYAAKIVSPVKCNEKPWDLWVSEIGHVSPRRDEAGATAFATPAAVDSKGGVSGRRAPDSHPYKVVDRGHPRYRRAGLNRLRAEAMSLHGLFPQMDSLNAAVCHMCGVAVKCSAAYRHLLEFHANVEPIRPPPPPLPAVRIKPAPSRSRHKKELVPPLPVDILPVRTETSPIHTATAPVSRIVMPQPELQYLEEPSTSSGVTGEVQVCVESGELPVVSIQDTEDLPLGENITDDIFAIMNSEGIQTADDITNSAEWKNIIRDIGNMQDINFTHPAEPVQSHELYASVDTAGLSAYTIADTELSSLQFTANTSPLLTTVLDTSAVTAQALKPTTPSTKSRSKSSKSKFNVREYDANKHCGVVTAENPKPCTRSLTCKAHALSLRRQVEGRSKPFDTLLAEHRAAKDAGAAPAAIVPPPAPAPIPPSLLVNTSIDLSTFNGLTAEQQVNDIYASLLSVEDPNAVLPDTSSITSLLSQPLPDSFLLPDDAEVPAQLPVLRVVDLKKSEVEEKVDEGPPPLVPSDVCWYASCPRPLSLCTFNASHAGGAITLGKKFATVRSNIKSSLSRSQCKSTAGSSNSYFFGQNALSLSKTVHMNSASKSNKPEVRKLIVTCSATSGASGKEVQRYGELFGAERLNGHLDRRRSATSSMKASKRAPPTVLDLGFNLDPLLADEKY